MHTTLPLIWSVSRGRTLAAVLTQALLVVGLNVYALLAKVIARMNEKHGFRRLVVWRYCEWRCEYREAERPTLHLYMGAEPVESVTVLDTFDALECSARWRNAVRGPQDGREFSAALAIQPDRRWCSRRTIARGGRRRGDA